ncbi:MAG TPA: glycoside hydrolase family 9 protein, partial [Longimicrobiales bacterium]|nr:glycoside hydrolase family 9 protein [Longimicrobiales bacterium]
VDFSEVRRPGRYVLRAGDIATEPFRIGSDVWEESTWAALNFFAGERCGHPVPGSHGVCHTDWTATFGDQRIVMNGGWHDAGDLSQGMVNTGEATYALFALAERLRERGEEPELLAAVLDEARWGLDWVLRVRFDGGHRVGFAGNNLWTNGILGDEDDPTAEAKNNPNINYIAAAAGAIGARLLRDTDPELAARALRIAEDDWQYAIAGTPGPETWATPAYGATPLELAGIGALASMELYDATGERRYADRAVELARDIVRSQQKELVGPEFPLAGFFYAGPDREQHFHQFHRGNDQAPIVALARLVERFPDHDEWMDWYGVIALYTEYQKWAATATAPFAVLPAYVYHEDGYYPIPQQAARHQGDREGFRAQVREGLDMGDGYYLRAFPVWFARRGNFGVLLSQAKGLAAGARVRGDADALDLARRQAQWILGLNPFTQSTMYGVGYDWAQQYSVSSGDLVGALPVGMQSYGLTDLPYWPSRNTYVYKEVWTHPVSRWLWLMEDLMAAHAASPRSPIAGLTAEEDDDGTVTIRAVASGRGAHTFELRAENVAVEGASRTVTLQPDASTVVEWTGRRISGSSPWVVVVVPDGDVSRSQDLVGGRRAVR